MLALLALAPAAFAETFTVTTTNDGSGTCTPSECTLREAVEAANAESEPSTIVVPPGFYGLTEAEYANGNDLEIEAEVTIEGAGADQVTIAQEAECNCRVIFADSPSVTISGATIAGGYTGESQGGENGADILFLPEGGGLLLLEGDVITEGDAGGYGGGIYVEEGELEMLDSTVSDNSAVGGGGIYDENDSDEPAVLERDTFTGNEAEEGGGIDVELAELSITNSTFNGNGSPSAIGGAILVALDSTVSLLNDTLSGDIAAPESGGAEIHATEGQQLNIVNTIVGPAAAGLEGSECFLDINQTSESNIDAGESCGFEASDGSLINTDPQIEPLAANGGPTETMALKPSSPAISAGAKAPCPAIDQRGVTRPQPGDASCDIGAYEYSPPEEQKPTPTTPTTQPAPISTPVAVCPEVKTHAAGFKPKVRPGHVVPGVRVRLATGVPSKLSIGATLLWKEGGRSRTTPLGKLAVEISQWRRVRFPIPAGLREKLPLGTPVTVKLRIEATPRGHTGCSATLVSRTVHAHVVKIFPHAVQFKRAR